MGKCAICVKKYLRGTGPFFRVPNDESKRLVWESNCRMKLRSKDFICADHFARSDIICGGKMARLLPIAVPCRPPSATMNTKDTPPVAYTTSSVSCDDQPASQLCTEGSTTELIPVTENSSTTKKHAETQTTGRVHSADSETQTYAVVFEALKEAEVSAEVLCLKKEIAHLKMEREDMRRKLDESNVMLDNFRKIFTEGQMRKMMSPDRKIFWDWRDISSAICLHASGPRAYHHLYDKGFPLPHVSTLQRWSRKTDMSEGLLAASFDSLEHMSELSDDDKMCVLSFDEMAVAESYEYDQLGDYVRKPAKSVQVVMARGLLKSWKQPLFYAFDTPMTKDILFSIIVSLKNINIPVVAVVSDMGPTNRTLWNQLNVTPDNPWFTHPSDEALKVFVFADAPHLLKLVRNHFLDDGIKWNGHNLTSRTLCDLLNHTSSSDVSIAFKLSHEHLSVKGAARPKVKTAAQLFSNTVANAIRRCYTVGFELYAPVETADFIQLVNDWFDILNSNIRTFSYPGKEPFGRNLSHQLDVLNRMNDFMSQLIVPGKKSIQLFQKGILITNRALVGLHNYLVEKSQVEYLLTYRLNQDVLENFFGAIRSKGGLNDHPTPKEFQYRLRKYILARNTESLRDTGNVSKDSTEWLAPQKSSTPLKSLDVNRSINSSRNTQTISSECPSSPGNKENDGHGDVSLDEQSEVLEVVEAISSSHPDDCGILQEDALSYISGYMIKKLKLEELRDFGPSFGFIDQVSKGFLKKPSPHLLHGVKTMEKIFNHINALEISHSKNLHHRLVSCSAHVQVPESIKRLFFKCRIHFRIRSLNRRLRIKKAKQRLMGHKKLLKFKL